MESGSNTVPATSSEQGLRPCLNGITHGGLHVVYPEAGFKWLHDELHRLWRDHVGIRPRYAGRGASASSANGATTTYGKERILAKPRFVNQTQPIEDGPPNIKMEGNDRQQANKDNITRPTNLENTTSSANVVRTVEPQTSMFASAERLSK
ncbi:hypothetical protein Bbelb_118970 [Branchiostoma belcheri]|nr:hypothetical protein Bbelb_118970 [Branchiostoma belcheri]